MRPALTDVTINLIIALAVAVPGAVRVVYAEDGGEVPAEVRTAITRALKKTPIDSIRPAPIDGLWEVVAGKNVLYAEPGGRYLIVGSIYDLETSTDLTAERRAEVNRIPWEELPLEAAVVRGDGSRKMAVFADPDCPFCRRLYHAMAEVADVTVYEVMYPLASLHPKAREKAVGILCAEDPNAALAAGYDRNREAPKGTESAECRKAAGAHITEALAFGQKHGIGGTPLMVRSDGRRHSGFMPPERLEKWLAEAGTERSDNDKGEKK